MLSSSRVCVRVCVCRPCNLLHRQVVTFGAKDIVGARVAGGRVTVPPLPLNASDDDDSGDGEEQRLSTAVIEWDGTNPFSFHRGGPARPHVPASPKGEVVFVAERGVLSSTVMSVEVSAGDRALELSRLVQPFVIRIPRANISNEYTLVERSENCSHVPCLNSYDLLHDPATGIVTARCMHATPLALAGMGLHT